MIIRRLPVSLHPLFSASRGVEETPPQARYGRGGMSGTQASREPVRTAPLATALLQREVFLGPAGFTRPGGRASAYGRLVPWNFRRRDS